MHPYTLVALIILALFTTGAYFYGTKKNRWISASATKDIEEVLKPITTNYVNIGGAIGYNFVYAMNQPFASAKGTLTLSPRHSLLYRPLSLLLGIRDRFFVNVFVKKKLRGEGHVVERKYLKKVRIDGIDAMERRETQRGDKSFVLLWRGADLSSDLEKLLDAVPDPDLLRHFCSYPETKTFFIHTHLKAGRIKPNLEAVFQRLPTFMVKEKD